MEQPFKPSMNFEVVLEVGAGNGEHLPYVKHNFKKYFMTDIRLENLPKTNVAGLSLVGTKAGTAAAGGLGLGIFDTECCAVLIFFVINFGTL